MYNIWFRDFELWPFNWVTSKVEYNQQVELFVCRGVFCAVILRGREVWRAGDRWICMYLSNDKRDDRTLIVMTSAKPIDPSLSFTDRLGDCA